LASGAQAIAQLRAEREEQRRRWAEAAREAEIARERQRRLRNFSEQLQKEAAAWHRYCEVKAYVEHLQSQINASETLSEQSREWLRLATHLARLTDPTKARLEALQAGISGYDYDLPFGRTIVS
jgi:chromosome segregation ATPase